MKKRLCVVLMAILALACLAGCGKGKESNVNKEPEITPIQSLRDINVSQYVTLGDYKGMDVTYNNNIVSKSELMQVVVEVYESVMKESDYVTDRPLVMGDTANIDYIGYLDGEPFEGGADENFNLTLGSNVFISGFEEGLVGASVGDTVDVPVTFPENYYEELAGKEVIFTCTVNRIIPGEMDDEVVQRLQLDGVENVADLIQYVYDTIYNESEGSSDTLKQDAVLNAFMAQCEFAELPPEFLQRYKNLTRESMEYEAQDAGMTLDEFAEQHLSGMPLDEFIEIYATAGLQQGLAIQAVANKEGLNIEDSELDAILKEKADKYGYASIEAYMGNSTREDMREYHLYEKVIEFLVENSNITEVNE